MVRKIRRKIRLEEKNKKTCMNCTQTKHWPDNNNNKNNNNNNKKKQTD